MNDPSPALSRLSEIAQLNADQISKEDLSRLTNEIERLSGDLYERFEDRRFSSEPPNEGESSEYFGEKLDGMTHSLRMLLGFDDRSNFSEDHIRQNFHHYLYLVKCMVEKGD